MNSLREFFHKDAVVEADKGIYTLEEKQLEQKQPGQKQKYKNNKECVILNLDNQRIKWFLEESSTMCDYAVLRKVRDEHKKSIIDLICIELKSKKTCTKKPREQLKAGELLCEYLIKIINTKADNCIEIKTIKYYILYDQYLSKQTIKVMKYEHHKHKEQQHDYQDPYIKSYSGKTELISDL